MRKYLQYLTGLSKDSNTISAGKPKSSTTAEKYAVQTIEYSTTYEIICAFVSPYRQC